MPRGRGDYPRAFKDITGLCFGLWAVLHRVPNTTSNARFLCRCACGTEKTVAACHLRNGRSTSCGCKKRTTVPPKYEGPDHPCYKHGSSQTDVYNIWQHMLNRCLSPKNKSYKNYGGRGITVCVRWQNSFDAFVTDMGRRPSTKHSIDRKDNNGNYEPGNCRWATPKQQSRNMRRNRIVEYQGERLSLAEAVERAGINYGTAKWRLRAGLSDEEALS